MMKQLISELKVKSRIKISSILLFLLVTAIASSTKASTIYSPEHQAIASNQALNNNFNFPNPEDEKKYQSIIQLAKDNHLDKTSMGNVVQQIAHQFLGAEYQAGLLDRSDRETLIISLKQFDCLLFIETVLAISKNINRQNFGYQAFSQAIENQRYWNGKMNGYCSRLHYFSDWIEDNQKRGNIKNITRQLGGIDTVKKLNFMTTHRSSYSNLVKSDASFKCITSVEESLSDKFNYIPTKNIAQTYSQLQPGDIVGVATNIAGLDFTHTGFAYRYPNGEIGLIHASPAGQVVIAQDLQDYISKVDNAIGIVVSRAKNHKFR